MATKKSRPLPVEVFKVKGETMKIASTTWNKKGFDNHHLEIESDELLNARNICNGAIYKKSRELYPEYIKQQAIRIHTSKEHYTT
jgi:hypothetical protein